MNSVIRFFSHPLVAALSSIAAIVGVPLAFYFYYAGIRAPNLTYHFHPVRTILVKAGSASALKVLFGGNEVRSDITAVQIAFWNAGKEPIPRNNILIPIEIRTENSAPILEATIRKMSRGVNELALDQAQMASGIIGVTWKILEQDDGGVIQLIYAGDVNNKLSVSGSVVGQRQLSELKYSGSIATPAEQYAKQAKENRRIGWVFVATGLLFAVAGAARFLIRRKHRDQEKGVGSVLSLALPFTGLAYAVLGFVWLYRSVQPSPPFGF
jgi:hypothetical protein